MIFIRVIDIFESIDTNKLVLPDFQRSFEWKEDDQKRLLSSFLVALPIGSLLLLKGDKDDFATKVICFRSGRVEPKEDCLYLLDGQQRVSSLRSVFSDFFIESGDWEEIFNDLYYHLKYRWYLRVKPPEGSDDDLFGWKDLRFKTEKYEPGQMIDYIECIRILKKHAHLWHSPGFSPKDATGELLSTSRRMGVIAKEACDQYLIPLYTLYNPHPIPGLPLHERVVGNLAAERVKQLRADVEDGNVNIVDLLEFIEPEIEQMVRDNDEDGINSAWDGLERNWIMKMTQYLQGLLQQDIHVIELPADEIGRATAIFEQINLGGTRLAVYDLIVAKAARDPNLPSLTKRIVDILKAGMDGLDAVFDDNTGQVPDKWSIECMAVIDKDNDPCKTTKNQYLNLLSIFCHCEYGSVGKITGDYIRKTKQLELNYRQINENTPTAVEALKRACAFLQFRCGIRGLPDLGYKLMILPIAYVLKDDSIWTDKLSLAKVEYWYWCSLFGGAYRERPSERCIRDIKNLFNWLKGDDNKFQSLEASLLNDKRYSDLETLLLKDEDHLPTQAISDGILQYVLSRQPYDFLPSRKLTLSAWDIAARKDFEYKGETYPLKVETHHIYPLGSATKMGEAANTIRDNKTHILNSPLNYSYISSLANRLIRDKSPNEYLQYVSEYAQWNHCIPSDFFERGNEDYEQILTRRYKDIKHTLTQELNRLKG